MLWHRTSSTRWLSNLSMRKRIQKMITAVVILATAGLLYYVLNKYTGFGIPCPLHFFTGLDCPGCGVTRMLFAILELDFASALRYNAVLFISLPLLIILAITMLYDYIKYGNVSNRKWRNIIVYCLIAVYILFGVLRNIPYFSFLSPE